MKNKQFKAKIINCVYENWWFNNFCNEIVTIIYIKEDDCYYVINDGILNTGSYKIYNYDIHGQIKNECFISLNQLRKEKYKRLINEK